MLNIDFCISFFGILYSGNICHIIPTSISDSNLANQLKLTNPSIILSNPIFEKKLSRINLNEKYSFLLESVEGGDQRGRYSLLGCKPDIIWKVKNGKVSITTNSKYIKDNVSADLNPIQSLRDILQLSKIQRDFNKTPYPVLVGYLGYPMIQYMEKIILSNPVFVEAFDQESL